MDSPYQEHLGTNYTPTADEVRGIQLVLDATAQKIVTLNAEIDKVRRRLDSLQEKRKAFHNFGEQHRALLSPVRRLTPDILEVIFLACLPSGRNPCMSSSEAPMLLTQICGSWRQIVMSAPSLWAAIHIVLPNICLEIYHAESEDVRHKALISPALDRREIAVSEWLGRSGVCPLSISIFEELPWFGDGVIDIGLRAGSLKALKSLHVTRQRSFYQAQIEQPKYQWKDVVALLPPHATSATFFDLITRSSDFSSIPLHAWQGLTELNFFLSDELFSDSTIDVNHFTAEVLSHCHSLVTLTLYIDCSEPVGSSRNEMTDKIVLPRVTTLSISLPPSSEGVAFAKCLLVPSLTELDVHISRFSHSIETTKQLVGTLLLSGGQIHTLNFCSPGWMKTSDDLVHILKLAPDVKRLTISNQGIHRKWDHTIVYPASVTDVRDVVTDNLLQSLSPSEDDITCPMLEEFVCSQDLITGITEGGLKDFLKARKDDPSIANIRRISVFINEPKREPVLGEERISLGTDSAVYFKPPTHISLSPFGGYIESERKFIAHAGTSDSELYTEF